MFDDGQLLFCYLTAAWWREARCIGKTDGDGHTCVALDFDLAPDLLHKRADQAVAKRPFTVIGHSDAIVTDNDLDPPWSASLGLNHDHSGPTAGESVLDGVGNQLGEYNA
nr:hypothetical protein [Paracoccus sp. M09]